MTCETARIDAGEAAWRPLLAAGFFDDETWGEGPDARPFAWAGPAAEVSLVLAEGGARELVLTARAAAPAIAVTAAFDGRSLGTRQVPGVWSEVRWALPAELAAAGPHRLHLTSSQAVRFEGDSRALSLAVDRIELSPAAQCAGASPAATAGAEGGGGPGGERDLAGASGSGGTRSPSRGLELAAGEILVAPLLAPPGGRARVRAALIAEDGLAGADPPVPALEGFLLRREGALALGRPKPAPEAAIAGDPGAGGTEGAAPPPGGRAGSGALREPAPLELALPGCCAPAAALVLAARDGPLEVTELAVTGDLRPAAWRRACGLLRWQAPALALFAAAAALLLVHARRRPPPAVPPPRWQPWLDAVLIAALAAGVRLLFLQVYPEPGRAADSYEYLMRSARLASGKLSLLRDTGWHAWQTWSRPPGYYLFLAAFQETGAGIAAALRAQALTCGVAAGATYLAGRWLFGRLAGWVAGLGLALYAESVVTFSRILSEPLYMLFVTPALAALVWTTVCPDWRPAALAGALFGLGTLVRSAPLWYVPLAALALLAATGPRRGWRPALAMTGALALTVAPWIVRNSWLAGAPSGIDDLSVINLLQVRPDDRFVRHGDLDLDTERGWRTYYDRLQQANRNGALSSRGGEVLRATVASIATRPDRALATLAGNLATHFEPYKSGFFGATHREWNLCRVRWVTDLLNLQHLALLVLGAAGLLLTLRDRRTWPLALWLVFNTLGINLLFHPEPKYRLPTMPVVMVWAGAAVAALAGRLPRRSEPASADGARDGARQGVVEDAVVD